ncbi:MAG: hypothetical protein SFU86_17435 [Pirellulaceae bacterium]|nr:hypothetical protein [Pirellulaceae bacterium]
MFAPLSALAVGMWAIAAEPPITAIAFAPDGQSVVVGSQAGVEQFAWPELTPLANLPTKLDNLHDLAFSPLGDRLAVAGGSPGESGSVELWTWPELKLHETWPAGNDVAYRVSWHGDGRQLAIACADRRVRIQPVEREGPRLIEAHSAAVLAVLWLPAENLIVSAGVDQSLRVLAATTGKTVRSLDNHTATVRDLALRPGKFAGPPLVVSAGADRTVRFWQPTIGRMVRFARLPSAPTAITWNAAGTHALAACEDGQLRAIDHETLKIVPFAAKLAGRAHAVVAHPTEQAAIIAGEQGELRKIALDAITP